MTTRRILIIGSGYTGLAAAHLLAKAGHQVTILEADAEIGGLAGTFELSPGVRVEKFYHHWFNSDREILGLIEELGLSKNIKVNATRTGLYYANSIFRLASPLDLLKFRAIPLWDRLRTGLMALYARTIRNFKSLENVSAAEWLIRCGGKRAYDVIWKPLLNGKFGREAEHVGAVWIWNKLALRGGSRNKEGKEELLYYQGSFGALTESIREALQALGVKFECNTPVTGLIIENGCCRGARSARRDYRADAVLATLPLPTFLALSDKFPNAYRERHEQVRFLGNVCLILRLKQSLSDTYWLNIADPEFPFVGIIEHTNFDGPENYGGEHIAYLSKYLSVDEPMFNYSDEQLLEFSLPHIKKLFPDFSRDWVIGYRVWRERYSQPVVTKHYSEILPPIETPIQNLYLATMAQIYPEDRGTNHAVRQGRKAAALLAAGL